MGVHSGTAVRRAGDWYGATVNVAARLVDAASAGEVLISVATRDLLASHDAMTIADLGSRSLKNVGEPVGVFGSGGLTALFAPILGGDNPGRREGATGKRRPLFRPVGYP